MGKHTAYWQQYQKAQVRGSLRLLAAIVLWLLATIVAALAHEQLGSLFPIVMGALLLGLAISLLVLGRNAYHVTCPECGCDYKRSKWQGHCPTCGLRLLQEDL